MKTFTSYNSIYMHTIKCRILCIRKRECKEDGDRKSVFITHSGCDESIINMVKMHFEEIQGAFSCLFFEEKKTDYDV